jgi:hypothetical protein
MGHDDGVLSCLGDSSPAGGRATRVEVIMATAARGTTPSATWGLDELAGRA